MALRLEIRLHQCRPLPLIKSNIVKLRDRELSRQYKLILESGLFDLRWYLDQYLGYWKSEQEALQHFLLFGWKEGCNPNPVFDVNWYQRTYLDVAKAGVNPLIHWIGVGVEEGRNPSPLFETTWYQDQNPDIAQSGVNPLGHWLNVGWKEGRDPNPLFDTDWYLTQYPDVTEAGLNPLVHYLSTGAREGRDPSPLFNTNRYLAQNDDVAEADLNPLVHYLDKGAKEGRDRPNVDVSKGYNNLQLGITADFDADVYLSLYPDITGAGIDPYTHYQKFGRSEGRIGQLSPIPGLDSLKNLDNERKTVLVVCHEGSRTGAPILGYNLIKSLIEEHNYNVVALFLGPGPILDDCMRLGAVVLGPIQYHHNPLVIERIVVSILEKANLYFAIINSVKSRFPLATLARQHIPTVTLIHEFATYTYRPSETFEEIALWSGATVFSSHLIREDAWTSNGHLQGIPFPIISQGRCSLPVSNGKSNSGSLISRNIRPLSFPPNGLVVVGIGTVCLRKGVDLFLECAARVLRSAPELLIHFVWVDSGSKQDCTYPLYSVFLDAQIQRTGLTHSVRFIDELPDLAEVYAAADMLLLSSRLDPLPNVAIDALSEGLPVLCFDQATGIAEILREHGMAEDCVAPYMDTAKMTEQILSIARSPDKRNDLGKRATKLAANTFQMSRYVDRILNLAEKQHEMTLQAELVQQGGS